MQAANRPTGVRWTIFALACGTSWFMYLHRYTYNFIRPQLQEEYGFSNLELESIYAVFNLTYGIGQIPSGIIGDLFGVHVFLPLIIVVWSAVIPCIGLTGNFYALSTVRVMFGFAQAGGYPSLAKVTKVWFPLRTRTVVQGWVASFFGRAGGALSPIVMASLLMGMWGLSWRVALVVMSAAGVLFALVFLWLYRNSPAEDARVNDAERELIERGEVKVESTGRVMPFSQVLRNPSMLVFVFQQFMNAGADGIYQSVMGSYFLTKGVDLTQAGLLVSMPLWGGAMGGMTGGYLNDGLIYLTGNRRWSRSAIGVSGKLIAAGVMFAAISQSSPVAIGIGLFVVKFFSDWTQPTVWGACTDMGGRYSATAFSVINTAGNVGGFVTPFVIGWVLDLNTEDGVTNFNPMFMLVVGMYLTSAVCWLFIDCTHRLESVEGETNSK